MDNNVKGMSIVIKTWPYGTTRRATVLTTTVNIQTLRDDKEENHLLVRGAGDFTAKSGDTGTLTFTKGGLTGGYWKFVKDEPISAAVSNPEGAG